MTHLALTEHNICLLYLGQRDGDQEDTPSHVTTLIYDQKPAPVATSRGVAQTGKRRSGRDDKAALCRSRPAPRPLSSRNPHSLLQLH